MNETEIVVGRAWRPDEIGAPVLWEELVHNTYNSGFTMGPYPFDWVFEVERMGKKDRVNVPAGCAMCWEPLL